MSIPKIHIHWHRNDLRLHDQPFVNLFERTEFFFGVYIIDPRAYAWQSFGFRKMGLKRIQFLRQNLLDLQQSYREKGSDLLVISGLPEIILPKLVRKHAAFLSFPKEYAAEERKVEDCVMSKVPFDYIFNYPGNFIVEPGQLGLSGPPSSFSKYRKLVERHLKANPPIKISEAPHILPPSPEKFKDIRKHFSKNHIKTVFPFNGGELAAINRLQNYLYQTNEIKWYKQKRNGLLGINYSSKFSPWLSVGAISPRFIWNQISNYESRVDKNDGTNWLKVELLWRDYFRTCGYFLRDDLFKLNSSSLLNESDFSHWKNGTTTNDFVNANMKELALTGFMSNRGRQNVASWALHELKLPLRACAAWFEHHLLDYDVYSNEGNWQYIAGEKFNPKGKSVFDLSFQAKRYDENYAYRKQWQNENLNYDTTN
jgi:deoxyribodipyrimidine photo-lyase